MFKIFFMQYIYLKNYIFFISIQMYTLQYIQTKTYLGIIKLFFQLFFSISRKTL